MIQSAQLSSLYKPFKEVVLQTKIDGTSFPVAIFEDRDTIVPFAGYEWAATYRTLESLQKMHSFVLNKAHFGDTSGYAYNLYPEYEIDLETGELFIVNIESFGMSNSPGPDGKVRTDYEAQTIMLQNIEALYQQLLVGPITKKMSEK
jgi:hypothetical protein